MGKKTKILPWKPVQLDGALFNGNVDGLIGIEECLDYDLNTVLCNKKSRKRKAEALDEEPFELLQDKKQKNKKLKQLSKEQEPSNGQAQSKKKKKSKLNESELNLLPNQSQNKKNKTMKVKMVNETPVDFTLSKQGSTDLDISAIKGKTSNQDSAESRINGKAEESVDLEEMHAWGTFGLPNPILKAMEDQGFKEPTPIQALTLPPAIFGRRDILGAAETGSGKTLAFGLPILTGILKQKEKEQISTDINSDNLNDAEESDEENPEEELEDSEIELKGKISPFSTETGCVKVVDNIQLDKPTHRKPLYALILTPTRELAVQVKNHLVAAAKYTGIKTAVVVGGMAVVKQERVLSKGPEIVVATPGRLWELIQVGNAHLSQIDDIRFLAIDETDRMTEKGHFKELHDLLERLNADERKRNLRQNFVFSATLTLVHELPRHLAVRKKMKVRNSKKISKMTSQQKLQQIIEMLGITNPKIVDVTQVSGTASTLSECRITCAMEERDYYVYYFLQRHPGRTLIFCNSIGCVKRLTTLLGLLGCNPMALHASMQQRQRLKNLDRFRDNENGILIATDVAARGLDIPCVEHVLHYQTPRTSESYVHRSGRTARALRQGITVLLVEPSELQNYLRLCRTLGRTQDLPLFPVHENMLSAVKQRVKLAREVDKLDLRVRRANSESGWLQRAAEEMDILIDDNISTKYDMKEARAAKKAAEIKRKQLAELLSKPLFPKGFSGKYPLVSAQIGIPLESLEQKKENAVDVLKTSVANFSKACKNKAKWLFKPKSWKKEDVVQEPEKKIEKNRKRNKNRKANGKT